jgi:cell division protein FtsL
MICYNINKSIRANHNLQIVFLIGLAISIIGVTQVQNQSRFRLQSKQRIQTEKAAKTETISITN